ncbi:MAG: hypothetical protein KA792_09235 [Bacteroidales bacterium]|nr:hypothetical protein [Bacteroidales bacterium]
MQKIFINSKRFRIALISILLLFIFLVSCKKDKDDSEDTTPVTPPVTTETIIATASGTIGTAGGTVKLSDGATVEIAAGVLTSDTKITINKIGNEVNFAADNRYCYEISGLEKGTKVKLIFPCPAGKSSAFTGVLNYNNSTYAGISVPFVYDSINGNVTVDNYTLVKKLNAEPDYRRWIVEWGDKQEYGDETALIPVPFYEQIGGSCWATDMTMLTKAYSPYKDREAETEIKDYLKTMSLNMDDGIGLYNFMKVLPGKFNSFTSGAGVTSESYFVKNNLLKAIIKRLKENKPVVLYMPNYAHAVLVVGYRTYLNQAGYDEYELVIHDSKGVNPPSADEGGMYTTRKWSWFLKDAVSTHLYLILYPGVGVHPNRALQTVGLPSYPSGKTEVSFDYYKTAGGSKGTISLTWDKSAYDGYKWSQSFNTFDVLPKTVKAMNLKLQLFNSDLSAGQNPTLNIKIVNNKKGKITFQQDYPVTLLTDKNPLYFNISLDTAQWLDNYNDTTEIEYYIFTRLMNKGFYQDGWTARFKIKGAYSEPKPAYLPAGKYGIQVGAFNFFCPDTNYSMKYVPWGSSYGGQDNDYIICNISSTGAASIDYTYNYSGQYEESCTGTGSIIPVKKENGKEYYMFDLNFEYTYKNLTINSVLYKFKGGVNGLLPMLGWVYNFKTDCPGVITRFWCDTSTDPCTPVNCKFNYTFHNFTIQKISK